MQQKSTVKLDKNLYKPGLLKTNVCQINFNDIKQGLDDLKNKDAFKGWKKSQYMIKQRQLSTQGGQKNNVQKSDFKFNQTNVAISQKKNQKFNLIDQKNIEQSQSKQQQKKENEYLSKEYAFINSDTKTIVFSDLLDDDEFEKQHLEFQNIVKNGEQIIQKFWQNKQFQLSELQMFLNADQQDIKSIQYYEQILEYVAEISLMEHDQDLLNKCLAFVINGIEDALYFEEFGFKFLQTIHKINFNQNAISQKLIFIFLKNISKNLYFIVKSKLIDIYKLYLNILESSIVKFDYSFQDDMIQIHENICKYPDFRLYLENHDNFVHEIKSNYTDLKIYIISSLIKYYGTKIRNEIDIQQFIKDSQSAQYFQKNIQLNIFKMNNNKKLNI